ncbi:MAG TPA: PrsW family intramembrane metalloprotease [Dehalococcoidales bacterium]
MLNIFAIVLIAVSPCAFWLWVIYLGDRCKPRQKRLMVRTFLLGLVVAAPVALIESSLYPGSVQQTLSVGTAFYVAFVVAGVTEETSKFLVVRLGAYNSVSFNQPEDGLIYAASAALGFASLENIIYVTNFGFQVILIRGLFSNLAHVLFSSMWGYPLALTKLGRIKNKFFTYGGLAAAVIAHGLFDFLFFTGTGYTYLVIPFFLAMAAVFVLMMRHANKISTCQLKSPTASR